MRQWGVDLVQVLEHVQGGSAEAAGYSSMKHTLREWGVIENASLTRPLREFSADEVTQLRARLADLPRGSERVAAPVPA